MKARFAAVVFTLALLVPVVSSAQNATLEITQDTLNKLVNRLGMLSDSGTYQPMYAIELPGIEICHFAGYMDCPWMSARPDFGFNGPDFGFEGPDFGFEGGRIPLIFCVTEGGGIEFFPDGPPAFWQWWVTNAYFTLSSGSMSFTATVRTRIADSVDTTTRTVSASVSFNSSTNRVKINVSDFKVPIQYRGKTPVEVDVARLYSISIPISPQTITVPMLDGTNKTVTARAVSITPQYLLGKIVVNINVGF